LRHPGAKLRLRGNEADFLWKFNNKCQHSHLAYNDGPSPDIKWCVNGFVQYQLWIMGKVIGAPSCAQSTSRFIPCIKKAVDYEAVERNSQVLQLRRVGRLTRKKLSLATGFTRKSMEHFCSVQKQNIDVFETGVHPHSGPFY
jgi:hypothetical protein